MKKPSILIFSQAMELGGVERSLLGLLDAIDYDRYDVDLFLMRHSGELMPYLNPKAKLLPEIPQYASLAVPMASLVKSGQLGVLCGRLKGKLAARRFDKQHPSDKPSVTALTYSHKYTLNSMPLISGKTYDLAISFLTPHYFAREQVNAKKYAAWIHTDYTALTFDRSAELAMWEGYDAICGVSEHTSESFQNVFPELAQKVRTVENILPRELTCKQAAIPQTDMPTDDGISLLSVGRFCEAKNFDNVPDICRRLVADGLDVKWYLIGYGGDEPLIRQKIDEAGMQELLRQVEGLYFPKYAVRFEPERIPQLTAEEVIDAFTAAAADFYEKKEQEFTSPVMREVERVVLLRVVDEYWICLLYTSPSPRDA